MKIQKFNENIFNTDVLKEPHDASSYQGTIVKVLPSDKYPKKYWNKNHYVERQINDIGILGHRFGTPVYELHESTDGKNGWYGSIFCTDAIEHENFEFIKGNIIYNSIGKEIGIVK